MRRPALKPIQKNVATAGAAAFVLLIAAPNASAELQGDAQAIALANEMAEAMGGRDLWARGYWLETVEKSHSLNQPRALIYTGFRNLRAPQGRNHIVNSDIEYEHGWTAAGGWQVANGEFREWDGDRLAQETDFWPREIYVMYHQLAAGNDRLRLISTGARSFRIEDAETDAPLGEFTISPEGGPAVWSSGDTEEDVTYVYGPLKSFGNIKLPAWGSQTNGSWRFDYVAAWLHDAPPTDDMAAPPSTR